MKNLIPGISLLVLTIGNTASGLDKLQIINVEAAHTWGTGNCTMTRTDSLISSSCSSVVAVPYGWSGGYNVQIHQYTCNYTIVALITSEAVYGCESKEDRLEDLEDTLDTSVVKRKHILSVQQLAEAPLVDCKGHDCSTCKKGTLSIMSSNDQERVKEQLEAKKDYWMHMIVFLGLQERKEDC